MTGRYAGGPGGAIVRRPRAPLARTVLLALAVVIALSACGSSVKGLIPGVKAGPLLGDFEAVQRAAENAGGDCSQTDSALRKTEADYLALPASVNASLRTTLRDGIENLSARAHELCTQPSTRTTTTSTTQTSTQSTTPTTTTPSGREESEAEGEAQSNPGGASAEEGGAAHERAGGAQSEERAGEAGGGTRAQEGSG